MTAFRLRPTRSALAEFVHHAITAWAIVGVTYLATVSGWLEFPDGVWLSALQRFGIDGGQRDDDGALPSIVVATIGAEAYIQEFEAKSPLNRGVLARHLERLIKERPSAIAIDLDLVPPVCSTSDRLDDALDTALSEGVQVFLITPLGVGKADETCARRWMTARCQSGVMFGYPDVQRSQGATLRYAKAYPSLGRIVREWYDDGGTLFAQDLKGASGGSSSDDAGGLALQGRSELCAELSSRVSLQTMRESLWKAGQQGESLPIDMRVAFPCRELTRLTACAANDPQTSDEVLPRVLTSGSWPRSLATQVVFLGGTYDPKDTVMTSVGSVAGVVVHAAIARSDITNAGHGQAYVLELIAGGALGWMLSWLWRRLYGASAHHQHLVAAPELSPRRVARSLAGLVGWVTLIGVVCVGFVALVTLWSWRGLAAGVWLSPIPLVLGMSIDTAVNASSRHLHHSPLEERPWLRAFLRAPALPFKAIIAMYSVWHLVSHAFEG